MNIKSMLIAMTRITFALMLFKFQLIGALLGSPKAG